MTPLSLEMLKSLWPNGNSKIPGLREGMVATAPAVFEKYGINNNTVLAQLMAQISHECGGGTEVVENMNYSAKRMMQVWPSRFPTLASTQGYANNPRALANKTYGSRMGNTPGTDDGWNYRGRGASQTTGKDGYQRLGKATGLPLVGQPGLVNMPELFLECGVADFIECGCLPYAQRDDILNVTKRLNGGTIGLDQRKQWLAKWKKALSAGPQPPLVA